MRYLLIVLLLGGCASAPSGDMGNNYGRALSEHIKRSR